MCSSNPISTGINRAVTSLYGTYYTGDGFYAIPDKSEKEILREIKSQLISDGFQGIGIPTILAYTYVESTDGGSLIKIK